MARTARLGLVLLLLVFIGPAGAQDVLRPAVRQETWGSIGVRGRLPGFFKDMMGKDTYKRFRLGGELGYRSADVFFAGRQFYVEGTMHYKISDLLSVGAEHRFSDRSNDRSRQRSVVQVMVDKEWDRFSAGYRFMYQHTYVEFGGQREVFRNKIDMKYNIPKWKLDPEFSMEFWTWAGNKGLSYFGTRYKLGTEYTIAKGHDVGFGILHDRERDKAWPTHRWIWSVSYTLNLRRV